ncbi:MAG: hypothetical protein EOO10_17035 [Chitinophagaceae bacterium]|nr:MAG: hypothetical protein EOO10_17035 [Chitinophagaceae bacterium]
MAVQLGSKRIRNIKREIIGGLNTLGFKVTEETDFFLGLIAKKAEDNIEYKINPGRRRTRSLYSRNIQSPKIKKIEQEIDTALASFTSRIAENSNEGIVSSTTLYLTMKGICPLWPFC